MSDEPIELDTRDAEPVCDAFTPGADGHWCVKCGWRKDCHSSDEVASSLKSERDASALVHQGVTGPIPLNESGALPVQPDSGDATGEAVPMQEGTRLAAPPATEPARTPADRQSKWGTPEVSTCGRCGEPIRRRVAVPQAGESSWLSGGSAVCGDGYPHRPATSPEPDERRTCGRCGETIRLVDGALWLDEDDLIGCATDPAADHHPNARPAPEAPATGDQPDDPNARARG